MNSAAMLISHKLVVVDAFADAVDTCICPGTLFTPLHWKNFVGSKATMLLSSNPTACTDGIRHSLEVSVTSYGATRKAFSTFCIFEAGFDVIAGKYAT